MLAKLSILFSFLYAQYFDNMKFNYPGNSAKITRLIAQVQGFKNEKYFCSTKPLKESCDQGLH